jgi:hypothetical protein
VIDLENLMGGIVGWRRAKETWTTYERGIGIQNGDRAIVVVSGLYSKVVRAIVPSYVRLQFCAPTPNAADSVLKQHATAEMNRTTFDIVIIASGDHGFVSTAKLARSRNMQVWLVTGRGRAARNLVACCPLRMKLRIPTAATRNP